jgi:hypothetical protein
VGTSTGVINKKKMEIASSISKFYYEKKKKSVSGMDNKRQS